jgi:hypothetical protein
MQTFLPYSSFEASAKCLDNKRLGNQRNETKVLLAAVTAGNGWSKHPAAKMWVGHAGALAQYGLAVCLEWKRRGFKDTVQPLFEASYGPSNVPKWVGNESFHSAHRSNLLRKNPDWYKQWGWSEPND